MFTVDELRAAFPAGRTIEIRLEMPGQPTVIDSSEFTAVDATNATIRSITRDDSGKVMADKTATVTWAELHGHGKFRAAMTTIEDNVELDVPVGKVKTRHYTVVDGDETHHFWFAHDLPGPPVKFSTEKNGVITMNAVLLRRQ